MFDHDLHIHTFLSTCCPDEQCVPANIIPAAAAAGLRTIGFADHMWDPRVPCDSDWHRPQTFEHISRVREMVPADTHGVRVLFGCETEHLGNGRAAVSPEVAAQLDFVLVPISHGGFVAPTAGPLATAERWAKMMLQWFNEAVELEVITGIAHAFLPGRFTEHSDEIIALIPDSAFADAFGRAAERGVSIGITQGCFPSLRGGEADGFHDETFVRVFTIAREAGCLFHFGSDAHSLDAVTRVPTMAPIIRRIGITPEQILPLARTP